MLEWKIFNFYDFNFILWSLWSRFLIARKSFLIFNFTYKRLILLFVLTCIKFWFAITIWLYINFHNSFILTSIIGNRFRSIRWFQIIWNLLFQFFISKRTLLYHEPFMRTFKEIMFLIGLLIPRAAYLWGFFEWIIRIFFLNLFKRHILFF